ncbi:MAG: hypothetical protein GX890_05680 [Firmicutes bacterium]|jgi:hypothetical protein|nr:hypothetical protein [Bacillota bacterium]HPU01470.1 hypothetical protein [Bacillota bacterium]
MAWVALIMALIALIQVPSLVNRKRWPELAGFITIWIFATAYALLIASGVSIPNPTELLRAFYSWFYPLIGVNI